MKLHPPTSLAYILIIVLLGNILNLSAQQPTVKKEQTSNQFEKSVPTLADSLQEFKLPFSLQMTYIGQYMQSVRLVFTLNNNTEEQLNNFWLHISLLDKNKNFLYREQPALFSEIKPHGKQSIEMLCESVGLEEVGYIVLHPQLLELERVEQSFDPKKVELIQAAQSDAMMVFNHSLR